MFRLKIISTSWNKTSSAGSFQQDSCKRKMRSNKEGEMVLMAFPAANRDPAKFRDADLVLIDCSRNPHAAFGLGIHRCIGSGLVTMETTVALEEWLDNIPEFALAVGRDVQWSEGTIRGPFGDWFHESMTESMGIYQRCSI